MVAQNSGIVDELAETLQSNAGRYFPEIRGEKPVLSVESGGDRALSSLYRFSVRAGADAREIIVKLPPPSDVAHTSGRPKLIRVPGKHKRAALEHVTLSAIDAHFGALDDPRFDRVRVLDFIEEHSALVLEFKQGTPLNRLLLRTNRFQNPLAGARVRKALGNAGAWLRSFHDNVPSADSELINDTRERFDEHIARFVGYLEDAGTPGGHIAGLESRILDASRRHLPDTLPTAIGHGDFAPRNVLVGRQGEVSVIDTRGLCRTTIYEDLAYFVMSLRTSKVQALSFGAAYSDGTLERQENAFLRGYFGVEPVPASEITMFVVQALLDKWCAHAERTQQHRERGGGFGRAVALGAIERNIRNEIGRQLGRVES